MTYTIAECTVNKLLMMDRRTVPNMWSFMTKYICEIGASSWFYYKETYNELCRTISSWEACSLAVPHFLYNPNVYYVIWKWPTKFISMFMMWFIHH